MIVNGAVTYVGTPDEFGIFNATILVRKTWSKKNDGIKDNVVLRLGPFGTDKKCPKVKARMSYIFFIRNSGERKGKYRFYKVQLFPAYASEANLKVATTILGDKPKGKTIQSLRVRFVFLGVFQFWHNFRCSCVLLFSPSLGGNHVFLNDANNKNAYASN